MKTIDELIDEFAFIDDWEERYRYVIELGKTLEDLPEGAINDANKVHGCVSQVWLEATPASGDDGAPVLRFRGTSDAHIVRGLIAILLSIYSGQAPATILNTDAEVHFKAIGLIEHLTPQRSNGLRSMVERIKADARRLQDAA